MSEKEQQMVYIINYSNGKYTVCDHMNNNLVPIADVDEATGFFFTEQELKERDRKLILDFIEKEVMAAFEAGAYWGVERYATTAGQLGFKIDTPDRSTYIESVKQKYK